MRSSLSPIEAHLKATFETAYVLPSRSRALRSSALPYCPVLDVLPQEQEYVTVANVYYMAGGTAFHTAVQTYASRVDGGERMWGRWKCPACGHKWTQPVFRPDRCPKRCNEPPLYDEIEFRVGPLTGHCDFGALYGTSFNKSWAGRPDLPWGRLRGKWTLHDFKTTGQFPDYPKPQHVLQLRTYCLMMELNYGIRIDYYNIVYVARENMKYAIKGPYAFAKSRQWTRDVTFRAIAGFKAATVVHRERRERGRPSKAAIRELLKHRPCRDLETHDSYMGRKYEFSREPCPLLPACSRRPDRVAKLIYDNGGAR